MFRLVNIFALAVLAAALAAPAALASGNSTVPDDRFGAHGINAAAAPSGTVPDDRAGARELGSSSAPAVRVSPDDRVGSRDTAPVPTAAPLTVRVVDGGFAWTDAGIGLAAGLGLALLLGGGLLAGRARGRLAH